MSNFESFTNDEILNLKIGIDSLLADLKSDTKLVSQFYSKPIHTLKKYGIKVMNYIKKERGIASRFTQSIREFIRLMNKVINSCFKCHLAVLIIMMATLGKARLGWSSIIELLDKILKALKDYFGKTSEEIKRLLNKVNEFIGKYRPSELALLICKDLNLCP